MTIHLQLLQKQPNRLLFYEKGAAYLKDKNTQVTDVLIAKLIGENAKNINFFSLSSI